MKNKPNEITLVLNRDEILAHNIELKNTEKDIQGCLDTLRWVNSSQR